jgi:diguanylate cyclase (GGDEF)-like protein
MVLEFKLHDGRVIRISHLNMEGGSYIASHEDMTETVRAESRLTQLARHDVLTNLANRIGFRENLGAALRAAPAGSRLAVLCLDLDDFKSVNDTLGHPMGDTVLVMVADRLRKVIGKNDLVARLGGDGFAIVQIGAEQPEGARHLARAAIETLGRPYDLQGGQVVVEASIGIALAPDHGSDADQVLKSAEMAQYWVKGHGRRTYQFFDSAMNAAAQSRHQIAAGLRGALEREELEVHYQPIVNLGANAVTGFEALLRWRHPERGYVPPVEFIPVAEETGLIVSIGEWVVRRACADAAQWPRDLHVAVNLSSVQFKDSHLVTTVFSALAAAHLPATRLELEITESVLLKDNEDTVATLHQLRDFGVGISMDDFGTGYSSLSYLRSFPFDKIKIDQSFIRDIVASAESRAIVRAVVGLGAEFGLRTTAEGVETPEQLAFLRAAGCTEAQGHYFSEARPVAELAEFLSDPRASGSIAA